MPRWSFPSLIFALGVLHAPAPAWAQDVTIYRCISASGALTLRDSPCAAGEQQESRSMQRPRDPPAAAAHPAAMTAAASPPAAVTSTITRIVQVAPARPMYECVSPDGERYTSDTDEGNPRWVPFWTLGYSIWSRLGAQPGRPGPGQPRPPPPGHGNRPPSAGVIVPAGGTWVRDECHALPQAEVCARLSDRRYEILRRYGSAMPSERRELDLEQRGIDARMANDCGDEN